MSDQMKIVFFFTVSNLFTLLNVVTAKERLIYWTDKQDDKIYCGDADGDQYKELLSSRLVLLLAAAQGYIYYYEENDIRRENMETRKVETLISETSRASSMVIDTLHSMMYWIADSGKIWQADMTGSNKQEFICGLTRPNNLALDLVYENLYWMNDTRDTLFCAGLDGEKIKSVIEHPEKIIDYVVDGDGRRIYFFDDNGRMLKSVNLDGNEEEIVYVFDNINPQVRIQFNHNNKKIYLADSRGIWRINTDGTESRVLVKRDDTIAIDLCLDLSMGEMYWYNCYWPGTIYRSRLDGRNVEPVIVNYEYPVCLALDYENDKIYWANSYANIYKCNTDGSNVEFLTNEIYPNAVVNDITLDFVNEKIYWVRTAEGRNLGRSNLDGTNVEYHHNVSWRWTYGIAVDPSQEKVYWSQLGSTRTTSISCADLNGQNIEMLVDSLYSPDDIALNLRDNKIYWTEHLNSGRICCANLDGSDIQDVVTGLKWPCGLALDVEGDKIYWIEREPGKIKRANLDGTEIEELYTGLSYPYRLALSFENNGSTGVEKKDDGPNLIPQEFALYQNYPNPFNSQTVLKYALPEACHVSLKIYNMLGEEVRVLANGTQGEGYKSVVWDGRDKSGELVSSGAYICKLIAGTFTRSSTMMFIK